jgi:steroid 5-alpha reductase family enzyme
MGQVLLQCAGLIFVYQTCLFMISLIFKRNDVADIGWGGGFIAIGVYLVVCFPGALQSWIVYMLTFVWGIRLSVYLFIRNRGKVEDFRYRAWREAWGKHFYLRSFLQVFLLQGFFMWLISMPLQVAAIANQYEGYAACLMGMVLWIVGFYCQAAGDAQLQAFSKTKQPGAIMQTGLWKYSRHPNYLGEILMWWGIGIIVFPLPLGWVGLLGPLTITWLLMAVSGVPMLEKKYQNHTAYQQYKLQTPALFPNIWKIIAKKK